MNLKLYNTATKEIEEIPKTEDSIKVYTCGLTVYDEPHIGNWFTFVRYDILIRTLKVLGYSVTHTMNITDVGHLVGDGDEGEDKLQKKAKENKTTAWDISKKYINSLLRGNADLNILEPDNLIKATDTISEQIAMVKTLEEKGFAYTISDGVYFDTSKFSDYGKMAKLDIENLEEGSRVQINTEKRNLTDFALWKLSPVDEQRDMEWESPWGKGFPGWHLECSAIANMSLGQTIDIHGGGIDLIPVHHTNEIAQSEAANDAPFVKVWFHSNFINIDGKKISKSLGNGITLADIAAKSISPAVIRLYVAQSNYRTEAVFSLTNIQATKNRWQSLASLAAMRHQTRDETDSSDSNLEQSLEQGKLAILSSLADNLNTPQALAVISGLEGRVLGAKLSNSNSKLLLEVIEALDDTLALQLTQSTPDISTETYAKISERDEAKLAKDYERCDAIRNELLEQGIELRDSKAGSLWSYTFND